MKRRVVGTLKKKRRRATENILNDSDYILPARQGVWLTVGNLSVRIKDDGSSVNVSVYPLGAEMNEELAELRVEFES